MSHEDRRAAFGRTLDEIQRHEQGHHGWVVLHRALGDLLETGHRAFSRLLDAAWTARPNISDAHLVTLLSVTIRQIALRDPAGAHLFDEETDPAARLHALQRLIDTYEADLTEEICVRSNSFTGARRFLVPQLIIGGFAAAHGIDEVRLLDLGTGAGILPRQLNNTVVFDRFHRDLNWRPWTPPYRHIPLTARVGVDAPPLPTLEWVRVCHGPSAYYEERFAELEWSFEQTAGVADQVVIKALDILDLPQLSKFIRDYNFNVVTCNFVLFQYDGPVQEMIERCVMENIASPGLFLLMNPSHSLLRKGCIVEGRITGNPRRLHLADLSDAHMLGHATIGADLHVVIGDEGGVRG